MAKARRIAGRVHRGWLFAGGGTFIEHLARVAERVGEWTRDPVATQAAWLYACTPEVAAPDLMQHGVAAPVARVAGLLWRRRELPAAHVDRVLRDRRAALVWFAVLTDWHRHLAGQRAYEYWHTEHERLAEALHLPGPAALPQADQPGEGEHLDPATGGPQALAALLNEYAALRRDPTSRGIGAVRSAIYEIATASRNAAAAPVADLADRWWNSTDAWEQMVAVTVRAGGDGQGNRAALLEKLHSANPAVAAAAIRVCVAPPMPPRSTPWAAS